MEVNNVTKSADRGLAKIKTFVLDILAPLTSNIECNNQGGLLSHKEVLIAFKTAAHLIGNANAQLSCLYRADFTSSFNKGILPLI